ncbi:hypothetical protein Y032_0016g3081 [Ancylostoma ceylanicum]|uniref:Uncharacterized protein n=1 Tax=Ancylostoma ceylanicum TaxID=53326 RepID=A0A016V6I2_9BILA|nr:hypothetical protein Y032_0016g3081 [Ancylostoma ceylanicum]
MAAKVAGKGPNYGTIRFRHDNARPLTIKVSRQKPLDVGREVLTSTLYSPDLVPKDYQHLVNLSNALQEKSCDDEDDPDDKLSNFFESMPVQFFAGGIETLPENWRRVIVCDGDLLIS